MRAENLDGALVQVTWHAAGGDIESEQKDNHQYSGDQNQNANDGDGRFFRQLCGHVSIITKLTKLCQKGAPVHLRCALPFLDSWESTAYRYRRATRRQRYGGTSEAHGTVRSRAHQSMEQAASRNRDSDHFCGNHSGLLYAVADWLSAFSNRMGHAVSLTLHRGE